MKEMKENRENMMVSMCWLLAIKPK